MQLVMVVYFRAKRCILVTVSVLSLSLLLISFAIDDDGTFNLSWLIAASTSPEAHLIKCYDNESKSDIDDRLIVKSKSIFFLETSCHGSDFGLNPRQACAIESAARLNHESDVNVLVPSPFLRISKEPHMNALKKYSNVKILHINMNTYFINTPLEEWYRKGRLKSSRWPTSHASDILRYTTLWKYGGYYIDLDVIMLKSFDGLVNFVGAESDEDVAAGVLAFTHNHPIVHLTMLDLKYNFKGWDWGNNGPGVVTRALKRYCRVKEIPKMTPVRCGGVYVLPPSTFYPIVWRKWKDYFATNPADVERVMNSLNNSIAIHLWNQFSASHLGIVGSNQPYVTLASRFCPEVYATLHEYF